MTQTLTEIQYKVTQLAGSYREMLQNPPKLDPQVKATWIAALRSGDYEQGTSTLKARNGKRTQYCCLGVLCEIAVKNDVIKRVPRPGRQKTNGDATAEGSYLPKVVAVWSGVTHYNPDVEGIQGVLSYLNDVQGWTFLEIAQLIEEYM